MRLIDADALIEVMVSKTERFVSPYKTKEEIIAYLNGREDKENNIFDIIDNQPTAYDAKRVIEEFEGYRAKFDCRHCKYNKTEKQVCTKDCTDALIDGLFDIVKAGGVE